MKINLGKALKTVATVVADNPALALAIAGGMAPKLVAKGVKVAPVVVPIVKAALAKKPAEQAEG